MALLVALFALWAAPGWAATQGELQQKLETTRQRLDQARQGIQQAEQTRQAALTDINALDRKIDTLEVQVDRLSSERDVAASRLAVTERRLSGLNRSVAGKKAQLEKAQVDLAHQREVLNRRATSIYKSGHLAVIEVLFQTKRLDELINRLDLMSLVARQDSTVLGQVRALQRRVTVEKAALEREQAAVAATERDQKTQADRLRNLVADRETALGQLTTAKSGKQAVVAKAEKDKASWEKQENDLLAESQSIASQLHTTASSSASGTSRLMSQGAGGLIRPVDAGVTSPFGYRMHPIFHVRKLHTGIDLGAGSGTSIRAAGAGRVVFAGWRGGYGRVIILDHGGGVTTLYAHQSALLVSEGRQVSQGQAIGRVGSTGYSTGPHLHFEVRVDGSPVDPMGYF